MTKKQRREYKAANQTRKKLMLADKSGPKGKNAYSSNHYGFIQTKVHANN